MITVLCSFRQSLCAIFLIIAGSLLQAGPYDAQPLRANLGIEPYFHTELGREKKRFIERDINRYRLFDFYRRQADHYLTIQGSMADVAATGALRTKKTPPPLHVRSSQNFPRLPAEARKASTTFVADRAIILR
jgi:hypothetical protein